jgi:hypothetical protein
LLMKITAGEILYRRTWATAQKRASEEENET